MTPIVADGIILILILAMLIVGMKKGFLESLLGIGIVVASFCGASYLARMLSPTVATWIRPIVAKKITSSFAVESTADVGNVLKAYGFSGNNLSKLTSTILNSVKSVGNNLLDATIDNIVGSVAYALVYVVCFAALIVILWLFTRPLKLAEKLPGLHTLNVVGGGLLGLLKGVLIVWVIVWAVQKFQIINAETIEQSHIMKIFANGGPLAWLTSF